MTMITSLTAGSRTDHERLRPVHPGRGLRFYTYYLTDAVAQPYVLRQLDLSHELSEER